MQLPSTSASAAWDPVPPILDQDDNPRSGLPPQILTRIVNGGGFVDTEYGVGRGRMDLLARMPYTDATGKRAVQREAVGLKVWHPGAPDPLTQGLAQLDGYLDRLSLSTGALVIFDRTARNPHDEAAAQSCVQQ